MYSFKRVTIDEEVYDHDISGYVKYIGYAIPVMNNLTHCSKRSTVKIDGIEYACPDITKLSTIHRDANGKICFEYSFAPVFGIWVELEHRSGKNTGMDTGYYGRIIVYDSTEEAIRFLEMLRDQLYSTPFYIETTKDMGIDVYATASARRSAKCCAWLFDTPYVEPDPVNKNKYRAYHVDIDELNSFIEDLRNQTVEFPVEYITTAIGTDPIEHEPVTEQPKRVTWKWSV